MGIRNHDQGFKMVYDKRQEKTHCYSLVNTILKVMTQLQMLYSYWLDQLLVWLLGFGANHSLLIIVQCWPHHIETRHIQYYVISKWKNYDDRNIIDVNDAHPWSTLCLKSFLHFLSLLPTLWSLVLVPPLLI